MSKIKQVTVELTHDEMNSLKELLKREPNDLELAMVDAQWSEHCSYKSSKTVLKAFPTKSEKVLLGPGYDAGVVDVGDGWVVTLHIESHNHPSAVDPYGGAATGVGGILRDILALGTRPIALLDSLRFGWIHRSPHSRWLLRHVVRGIADYGNCTGVPTVGGEVDFDRCFETNCLVDVLCVGLGRKDDIVLSEARYPGDALILVGGRTGRDGIRGAAFASRTLVGEEGDRSAVQIPDPFTKKLIIDATLDAVKTGRVRGLKDLGGGGLTCALSEMADKGNRGVEIDISKVLVREEGMTPFEIMISESQERMLFVVEEGYEVVVTRIFEDYELPWSVIGRITKGNDLVVKEYGVELSRMPAQVVANAPLILRQARKPSYLDQLDEFGKPPKPNLSEALLNLLSSPTISSKRWIYEQYDHEVGVRTILKPGQGDSSVLRLPNGKFLAVKVDGNSRHSYLDPYMGAAGSLAEACRNVVAVGAEPLAMVDHMQFGDPSNPEVFWTFKEAVRGMADYCKALNLPCIGGKVSFYNEDKKTGTAIKPSPVAAVIGLIDNERNIRNMGIRSEGEEIIAVGLTKDELGGSEYYEFLHGITGGRVPQVDLRLERRTFELVKVINREGLANAVHDCSSGGLAVCLAESSMAGGVGVVIDFEKIPKESRRSDDDSDEILFSETHGRFIISTSSKKNAQRIVRYAEELNVPCSRIGLAKGHDLIITEGEDGPKLVSLPLAKMEAVWSRAIEEYMRGGG